MVKPSGMPSVEGHHSLASVEQLMRNENPLADSPLIVHRLDMDTSGIMIIAKTKQAHKFLQEQFALAFLRINQHVVALHFLYFRT